MKKVLSVAVIIVSSILATGCGKDVKELSCTMDAGDGSNVEIISTFEDQAYKSSILKINVDLSSFSDSEKEAVKSKDLCSIFYSAYKFDKETCKTNEQNDSIEMTADYDFYEQLHQETKRDESQNIVYKLNLEDSKQHFEDSGYSCKIN